ncbi:MAG: hypothetical protein QNJ70_02000 [Xenococcaceae cyanobacterium MO_207.B15]|nr:hypothetical protein [Xenococcaceae cyanobacterium MO_207.B15]
MTQHIKPMTGDKKMWKKVVCKTGVWFAIEIWLNIIGLDNIADYTEFIFAQDYELNLKNRRTVKITDYPPEFCSQIDDFCPIPGAATTPQELVENGCNAEVEVFKHKCQQLPEPCIKIVCLATKSEAASSPTCSPTASEGNYCPGSKVATSN